MEEVNVCSITLNVYLLAELIWPIILLDSLVNISFHSFQSTRFFIIIMLGSEGQGSSSQTMDQHLGQRECTMHCVWLVVLCDCRKAVW